MELLFLFCGGGTKDGGEIDKLCGANILDGAEGCNAGESTSSMLSSIVDWTAESSLLLLLSFNNLRLKGVSKTMANYSFWVSYTVVPIF